MLAKLSFLLLGLACARAYAAPPMGRVVNGTNAVVENYPFVVSLRGSTGSHSCGGSIISQLFVMTAAHCTDGRVANQMTIQYGVTNIAAYGPNVVAVARIIQHENYNPYDRYANDISLLQVAKPFVFNYKTVAPVRLPLLNYATPQVATGAPGTLVGWGLNETGGYAMKTLQQVHIKVYSDQECVARHEGATNPRHHICGGVDEGGKGQCSGDSGGPLISGGQQVGIVSWSIKPCTVAPYPGVYCKVANYVDWIKRNQIILA